MVLIQKIGIGLAVQLLGLLLFISGYQSFVADANNMNIIEQTPLVQWTIRLCIGLIPSLLVITGLRVMKKWDKDVVSN